MKPIRIQVRRDDGDATILDGVAGCETLTCPLLGEDGRCTVYAARPLICRLYGSVSDLRCPHGCVPDRLLTPQQARRLIGRIAEIDPRLATLLPEHPSGSHQDGEKR